MLRRIQLFEFCDQPWLRGSLREAFLDCLSFVHHVYQPYYHLAQPFAEWANQNRQNVRKDRVGEAILDLASGSGEQITMLLDASTKQGLHLPKFILSDLYPNLSAWHALQKSCGNDAVGYIEKPLSALDIPEGAPRHWTIFTAFHHLSPAAARILLQGLVAKGDGLCIIENTRRQWFCCVAMVLGLPVHLIVPFFAKRFKWSKFLCTTVIPIIPLMVAFDGVVSALRSYTKEEIIAMLPPGSENIFTIEYREVWWRFSPLKATMFLLVRK